MSSSPTPSRGDASAPRLRHTTSRRLARLTRKELREILRDRRTIVTLVVMPLLVYPLLSITFQRFFLQSFSPDAEEVYIIGVESEQGSAELRRQFLVGHEWLLRRQRAADSAGERTNAQDAEEDRRREDEPRVSWAEGGDLHKHLLESDIDVAVVAAPAGEQNGEGGPTRWQLLYREGSPLSRAAVQYLEQRLRAANERFLYERLEQFQAGPQFPVAFQPSAIVEPPSSYWATTMIPLILILMTITGAVYPAIDLTAGERERGTLETLMAAPVPRGELLLAKYVAVLTVALLTATANLTAMTVTLSVGGLSKLVEGLSLLMLVEVFGLTILFASFFSAVVLALTSFARSFKEAQAYLIPLMLLCLTPGVFSLMPGLKLNSTLSIVPLVNIVLLARDVLADKAELLPAIVSIVSTLLYALAAIGVAARVFGSDAVLYGSQSGWSDLFRRPAEPRKAATLTAALFCLALMFPATYVVSGLLSRMAGGWMELSIALSGVATLLVYGLLPGLFVMAQRVDPTSAFRAYAPRPRAIVGALLLGFALWPLLHESFVLLEYIGLGSLELEKQEWMKQILERWRTANPAVILISLALLPAMCEEWFFRGYLFSALLKTSGTIGAIIVSSLLFGAFHVVTAGVLATERFATTTLLGLVLALISWRTGSIVPGMMVHVVHNSLMILLAIYADELAARGWIAETGAHLPLAWLAVSAVVVAAGAALLSSAGPPVEASVRDAERRELSTRQRDELETSSG